MEEHLFDIKPDNRTINTITELESRLILKRIEINPPENEEEVQQMIDFYKKVRAFYRQKIKDIDNYILPRLRKEL